MMNSMPTDMTNVNVLVEPQVRDDNDETRLTTQIIQEMPTLFHDDASIEKESSIVVDKNAENKFPRGLNESGNLLAPNSEHTNNLNPVVQGTVKATQKASELQTILESNTTDNNTADESSAWNEWLSSVLDRPMDSGDAKKELLNLDLYLSILEARNKAKNRFENAIQDCLGGLTKAMTEEMLADSVGVVSREQGERFEVLENNLVHTMQSNHQRRVTLQSKLDKAHGHWNRNYKKMRLAIEDQEPVDEIQNSKDPSFMQNEDAAMAQPKCSASMQRDGEGILQDLDWNAIIKAHPKASDSVRAFLGAREKLRDADEGLSYAMDNIHANLKSDADAIAEMAIAFYRQRELETLALEQDIQYLLMSNAQRRDAFEERLKESAKQAQGVIATLLSRLAGSSAP